MSDMNELVKVLELEYEEKRETRSCKPGSEGLSEREYSEKISDEEMRRTEKQISCNTSEGRSTSFAIVGSISGDTQSGNVTVVATILQS
jgi:hypothetical protein